MRVEQPDQQLPDPGPRAPGLADRSRRRSPACLDTCWRIDREQARMVLIPNTLELTTIWVTPALAAEVEAHPDLAFETEFRPIPLDDEGSLDQERLFPESHRACARRPIGRCSARSRAILAIPWIRGNQTRGSGMAIRAVVFDLDGLMFDTEALFFQACSRGAGVAGQAVHARDHAGHDRPAGGRGRGRGSRRSRGSMSRRGHPGGGQGAVRSAEVDRPSIRHPGCSPCSIAWSIADCPLAVATSSRPVLRRPAA